MRIPTIDNTSFVAQQAPSQRLIMLIVVGATVYQTLLCLIHTHLFRVSTPVIGAAEFSLYLLCSYVLLQRLRLDFIAVAALIGAYLLLLSLLRTEIDFKGFRDVIIPILFYWVGRRVGSIETADRILKVVVWIVLALGFFELFFLDYYSKLFNVFSYYASQTGSVATNWAKGSVLALNSIRPEGIGRTILPSVLGSHRVSAVFMEPVSLGNFAVITAGWGLSKGRDEWRKALFFLAAAAAMITMADSRYGLVTVAVLVAMRFTLWGRMNTVAIVAPLVAVLLLIGIVFASGGQHGDNMLGRLFISGETLLRFDFKEVLGLSGFKLNFGDMGYAVVFTRYGLVLAALAWIGIWLIRMQDDRGIRFRAYVAVYASLILMISGTSFFALKTAGILWFMIGCCAIRNDGTGAPVSATPATPAKGA